LVWWLTVQKVQWVQWVQKVGSIFRFCVLKTFVHLKFFDVALPSPFGGRVGDGGSFAPLRALREMKNV
jgi:hypothetical protein